MPKFEPKFVVKSLQDVAPGTPIIFQRTLAIAALNRSAQAAGQQVLVILALHDANQSKFVYRYFDGAQPNVLVPTGEIICRPNLYKHTQDVSIQPATNKLFLHGDDTYIVVETPNNDVRLLNLGNGSLVRPTVTSTDAFDSWELGVVSMGEFVSLLKI